jgi:hypothetical protein
MNTPYKNKEILQIASDGGYTLFVLEREVTLCTTNAVLSLIGLIESFLFLDQLKFELPVETQVFSLFLF